MVRSGSYGDKAIEKINVLVVEDSSFVIENLYKECLSSLDVNVDYVQSELEAIEKIRYKTYNIVFIDIMLRDDVNDRGGIEVLKYIRRQNKETTIIVVTGTDDIKVPIETYHAGVSNFILKENLASPRDLVGAVEPILKKLRRRMHRSMLQASIRDTSPKPSAERWIPDADLQSRFKRLSIAWRKKSAHISSPVEIAMMPEYQEIIGMGVVALPFIIQELEDEPDHWFWALRAITGIDAVSRKDAGRINKMAQAWIEWARENGLI